MQTFNSAEEAQSYIANSDVGDKVNIANKIYTLDTNTINSAATMPSATSNKIEIDTEANDISILEEIARPGEAWRAGIISVLEGEGIETTKANIKAAWEADDPKIKDSFMELIHEKFDKVRLAPEGTYGPVLTALAKNSKGSAAITVGFGLTADIIADPLTWVGSILGVVGKGGKALSQNTKVGKKLRTKKANKIQEKIKKRQTELIAREGMSVKEAGYKAYMEKSTYHGLLDDTLGIKTPGQIAPGLNKFQFRKLYNESRPTTRLGKLTDRGFQSINKLKKNLLEPAFKGINATIEPILSRAKEINGRFGAALSEFEMKLGINIHKDIQSAKKWIQQYRNLPKEARIQLTKHLNNKNFNSAFAIMAKIDGMSEEFVNTISPMLKQRGADLSRTNKDLVLIEDNFFPRSVKDRAGLMDELNIDDTDDFHKIIFEDMLKSGRKLNQTEYADAINRAIRRPTVETIAKKIGAETKRKIDIIDDSLMKYYDEADNAILSYLRDVNHAVYRRHFFGKFAKGIDDAEGIEESIGAMIASERRAGRLSKSDLKEMESILKARFIGGEQGANKVISNVKAFGYMTTLGNPFSALTQLGDIGTSAFLHGIINTTTQAVRGLLGKKNINFEDFGLDLMAELSDVNKTQKHLTNIFRYSGFRAVDIFGKNVNINSSLAKWSKIAKDPDGKPVKWYQYDSGKLSMEKQLRDKYRNSFDKAKLDKVVEDFRNYGKGKFVNGKKVKGEITDDMRYIVFNDLIDAQPVVQSAMPAAYLNNPNGRIAYQLKTFALKQLDLVRKRAFKKIKQGDVLGGSAELARYGAIVGGANTGSESLKMAIRDWINGGDKLEEMFENEDGEDLGLPAVVVANTVKVFGMNSVLRDKVTSGYWSGAASDLVMPPVLSTGGDMFAAMTGQAELWKGIRQVPIGGKALYYMFGEDSNYVLGGLD